MNKTQNKDALIRFRNVSLITALILCISALLLFLSEKGIAFNCFFHKITGLSCPACGNTRAVIALLNFDMRSAFTYNRLFLLEIFYIGWVYCVSAFNYIKGRRFSYRTPSIIIDICFLVIFILWGIARNILNM